MPETQYDIRAQLTMDARRAHGQTRALAGELRSLGQMISGTSRSIGGMMNQLVGVGATYLGLRAVSNTFSSLTRSAVDYTANLEKTRIGLQSIIQGVEGTSWEDAGKRAEAAFQKIRDMAIVSPATSAEMFDIFSGIVGPIESAGFSMQKVLDITQKATLAASALNVDYAQAARDINMMARGTAGMEVKTFSMLRSMGAIKEDAEAWNKTLTASQRVEKLEAALSKFAESGTAFGSSWVGVTSSFKDIVDNFKGAAMSPIMGRVAKNIQQLNTYMLDHRQQIEAFMATVGSDVAWRLQKMFDRAREGFTYVINHWDEIVKKFDHVVGRVKEVAPMLAKAAIAWQAVQLGRNVVGGAVGTVGAGMEVAGMLRGAGGALGVAGGAGGAKAVQTAVGVAAESKLGGLFGAMGAGSGAASTGIFGMMGAGTGGGAAAAAAAPAAAAAGVGLAPILLAIAAALAVFLAIALAAKEQWASVVTIFGETFAQTGAMIVGFAMAIWKWLAPPLKLLGSVLLVGLSAAFLAISAVFRSLLFILTPLFDVLGSITTAIYGGIKPAFDWLFGVLSSIAKYLNDAFGELAEFKEYEEAKRLSKARAEQTGGDTSGEYQSAFGPALLSPADQQRMGGVDLNALAKGQVNVNQDFRGSRINVRQEFKGNTDPDRVVTAMMRDLTRQAESRVSSGFAGALTR